MKKHNVATVQRCIMILFRTILLIFSMENYKADAKMMMVFSLACYKHAKGFGRCALFGLQVFITRELFYYVADRRSLGESKSLPPLLPAALAKNKRFVSSRSTWSDHVAKISAIPLNNSFQKTMKMIS